MIETLAENLVNLKKAFALSYDGASQIQEVIQILRKDASLF